MFIVGQNWQINGHVSDGNAVFTADMYGSQCT